MNPITESTVESAALSWFQELGYAVRHGPDIAPGEFWAERASYGDVMLVGRLRSALARINPNIPSKQEKATQTVLEQAELLGKEWVK